MAQKRQGGVRGKRLREAVDRRLRRALEWCMEYARAVDEAKRGKVEGKADDGKEGR